MGVVPGWAVEGKVFEGGCKVVFVAPLFLPSDCVFVQALLHRPSASAGDCQTWTCPAPSILRSQQTGMDAGNTRAPQN